MSVTKRPFATLSDSLLREVALTCFQINDAACFAYVLIELARRSETEAA